MTARSTTMQTFPQNADHTQSDENQQRVALRLAKDLNNPNDTRTQ